MTRTTARNANALARIMRDDASDYYDTEWAALPASIRRGHVLAYLSTRDVLGALMDAIGDISQQHYERWSSHMREAFNQGGAEWHSACLQVLLEPSLKSRMEAYWNVQRNARLGFAEDEPDMLDPREPHG